MANTRWGTGQWGSGAWGIGPPESGVGGSENETPEGCGWGVDIFGQTSWSCVEFPDPSLVPPPEPDPEAPVVATNPNIRDIDIWAHDLLFIEFDQLMANNDELKNDLNYIVTPLESGIPVQVVKIRTGNEVSTNRVFLVVTDFTIGEEYEITVSRNIRNTAGAALDDNVGGFIGRITKLDSGLESVPNMYDKSPDSRYRQVMNAIFRSDDILGGTKQIPI